MDRNQQTNFKESELWQAGSAVADSLSQFEGAMDKLVGRLEMTGEQMQRLMEIKDRAQNIVNQISGYSHRVVNEVKKNPTPYVAMAAVVGLFLLSRSGLLTKNNVIGELVAGEQHH